MYGVDRDEVAMTGVELEDPITSRDRLGQMIRSSIVPTPSFEIEPHTIDGRVVVVLRVASGPSPPYGLIADANSRDKPEFYVRRGANTHPAQPGDLREVVLARLQSQAQGRARVF